MLRLFAVAAMLAISMQAGSAQTTVPNTGGVTTPSGQNSGAGIPGHPGSKSGPAVKPPSDTTGAAGGASEPNNAARQQDPAKIPGLPGSKSGPTQTPPADKSTR